MNQVSIAITNGVLVLNRPPNGPLPVLDLQFFEPMIFGKYGPDEPSHSWLGSLSSAVAHCSESDQRQHCAVGAQTREATAPPFD